MGVFHAIVNSGIIWLKMNEWVIRRRESMSHSIEITASDWSFWFSRMNSNKAKDEGSKEKWLTQKKMFSERILIYRFVLENDSNFAPPHRSQRKWCLYSKKWFIIMTQRLVVRLNCGWLENYSCRVSPIY